MTEILRLLVIVSLLLSIFDLGSRAQSTSPNAVMTMRDVEEIMHTLLLPDGGCDTILLDHDTHVQDGHEAKRYVFL